MNETRLFEDLHVSRETIERLERHVALLKKWSPRINLVARSTLDTAWERHVLDSAQLWPLIPARATRIVDLGSGAGFPGLVLGMLARERGDGSQVFLVESDRRKAAFLREVIRETGAGATVLVERAESLDVTADVVTARGFAGLDALLGIAAPIMGENGIALLHKGARYESELTDAARNWHMETHIHRSRIDPASAILRIGGVSRRQDGK